MNNVPSIQFPLLACARHICMIIPLCFAYVLGQKILIDLKCYYESIEGDDGAVSYLYTYFTFGNLFSLASKLVLDTRKVGGVNIHNTFTKIASTVAISGRSKRILSVAVSIQITMLYCVR